MQKKYTSLQTLYLVATPIGNLADITLRALQILQEVDVVLAEDTRHVQKIFSHYTLSPKHVVSFHEHNAVVQIPRIITLLKTQSVALVSDSGTPTISDPGYKLVRACVENAIPVLSIPGPCSIIAALIASGLPTDHFAFLGFLPRTRIKKQNVLNQWKEYQGTVIIFESPHRIRYTLQDMATVFEYRGIVVVARELTKIHEEYIHGSFETVINHPSLKNPKGEMVILWHQS